MSEEAVTFPSAGLKISGVVHVPSGLRPGERRAAFLVLHGFGSNKTSSNTIQPTKVLSELGDRPVLVKVQPAGLSLVVGEHAAVGEPAEDRIARDDHEAKKPVSRRAHLVMAVLPA